MSKDKAGTTKNAILHTVWDQSRDFITTKETQIDEVRISNIISTLLCSGPFYFYIVDFFDREIDYMHPNINQVLGLCPENAKFDDIISRIHPDDMDYVAKAESKVLSYIYQNIGRDRVTDFKMSYCFRFKVADGSYQLFQHQALILTTDDNGGFSKSLNIHTNINHLTNTNNYMASVISIDHAKPSFYNIDVLGNDEEKASTISLFTKREKEIITLISKGLSTECIAKKLYLSINTISTHRKNILNKANCKNTTELIVKCIKEGLV